MLVASHLAAEPVCNEFQPGKACQASVSPAESQNQKSHAPSIHGYHIDGLVLAIESATSASFNAMAQ